MLSGLETRGAGIGARAANRAAGRVTAVLRAAVPDRAVARDGCDVVVTGRGLADDPRLRWIGSLLK